jgi:hypothetical protein
LLNDRPHTDTFGCRLSLKLYRREADNTVRKVLDNPMRKGGLSVREKVGFNYDSSVIDTHNLANGSLKLNVCIYN